MAQHDKVASTLAQLNDEFRRRGVGGSHYITAGIQAKGAVFVSRAMGEVSAFDDFDEENDPYGHHDFGSVTIDGQKVFWKIDYYDAERKYGSEDPADPAKTHRVLTVMFASEY